MLAHSASIQRDTEYSHLVNIKLQCVVPEISTPTDGGHFYFTPPPLQQPDFVFQGGVVPHTLRNFRDFSLLVEFCPSFPAAEPLAPRTCFRSRWINQSINQSIWLRDCSQSKQLLVLETSKNHPPLHRKLPPFRSPTEPPQNLRCLPWGGEDMDIYWNYYFCRKK